MTDEFLTKGLQEDRYLKAVRLTDQFEAEIESRLTEFGQRMVDQKPDLFASDVDGDARCNRTPSNGLALYRINYDLDGSAAPDGKQKLNVHLYWMSPAQYGRPDIDGALRGYGYKVKYADTDIDDEVVADTQPGDWDVQMAENPFDSNIVFYRHISSAKELAATEDVLVDHFDTFGDTYSADEGA